MANIKVIRQNLQTNTGVTGSFNGSAISIDGALTVAAQPVISASSGLVACSAVLQTSADPTDQAPTNWNDYGSSQNITIDGPLFFEKANPSGNWVRMKYTVATGNFAVATETVVKGPI